MIDDLIDLTERLSDVIARETQLLNSLDLSRAGSLVGEKMSTLKALQAAYLSIEQTGEKPDGAEADAALRKAIRLLEQLGDANRSAIERGLALQMRLIETIAHAIPRAAAQQAPVYQHDGSQIPPRLAQPYAFLSRM
jgi:hypothetical protein